MESVAVIIFLFLLALLLSALVLPIVTLVISIRAKRTSETIARLQNLGTLGVNAGPAPPELAALRSSIQQLAARVDRLEKLRAAAIDEAQPPPVAEVQPPPTPVDRPKEIPPAPLPVGPGALPARPQPPPAPPIFSSATAPKTAEQIESIVGRRAVGWAAVVLIILATAFFLKYAFDNRWIGELGRVSIGVIAGVGVTLLGYRYHKKGWRIFSQILTACGIVLLYLSVYAAFGYYHLTTQKAAFVYLTILITEAGLLAILYEAPAIAVMALLGGFLAPILLRSDRDQYRSLFGYITLLDVGALALFRQWPGLSSLAFAGTHSLFWLWFAENYHPQKRSAVMIFQTGVFLIFLLAHTGRRLFTRQVSTIEDLVLLLINPFVFFATAYGLLDADYHDWLGVFAIGMALLFAVLAKILLTRSKAPRLELLTMMAIALTFVTLAIPIQLKSNWITIAWSIEALALLGAGIEIKTQRLQAIGCGLFGLALAKLVLWDTPWAHRAAFTPVVNRYFLSALVVIVCLGIAAALCQKLRPVEARMFTLGFVIAVIVVLWFVMSIETFSFFNMRAAQQEVYEDYKHELWLGQMALSVLWSVYAAILAAIGFIRRQAVIRWAALALFGLTTIKVMMVDIAVLQRLYRIIAFFVLGLLLLLVAWGYHKAFHARESSQ